MYDDFINEIDELRCENLNLKYKLYKKEKQQKEFIKYLEDEINSCESVFDLLFNFNKK